MLLGSALLLHGSSAAGQPITLGPYSFSTEDLFVQTATFTAYPGWDPESFPRFHPITFGPPSAGGTTLEEAITGFSPDTKIHNVGNPCGPVPCDHTTGCPPPEDAEVVEVGFHPQFLPFEAAGPDILVFDGRASMDDYAVAVRPVGGLFLGPEIYRIADQVFVLPRPAEPRR